MNKIDISSLTLEQLEKNLLTLNEKKFRAKQIYKWLHQELATDFNSMSNISLNLRTLLDEKFYITTSKIISKSSSKEDETIKYLFNINENTIIESVFMKYKYGNSVCVSTQAGCRMGCKFCASTTNGLDRNLTASEILNQVYSIQKDTGLRVSNIVLMGSGEPLDNFNNVLDFITIINSEEGLNIGERHITLSTCGLVDRIYELAELNLQINLAISLHASNDVTRKKIMPIAKKSTIEELTNACKYYGQKTKRRVTYEYALIKDLNDSQDNAYELAKMIKGTLSHVNLIPVNEVKEHNFIRSDKKTIENFANILQKYGIETTVRRKLGSDVNAACGQLRNQKI